MRRRTVLTLSALASLAGGVSAWWSWPRGPRWNLLLISIDTLRADHLSVYGYERPTSPAIDQLARRGHVFRRAYSTCPMTLPSHTSMLTGMHPAQLGVTDNFQKVPQEAVTLAEVLKNAGYATGGFVSANPLFTHTQIQKGFEVYDAHTRIAGPTVQQAINWMDVHKNAPHFAFVHLFDPHSVYHAPSRFRQAFRAPQRPMPPDDAFIVDLDAMTPQLVSEATAAYDAEISYADSEVGRLLKYLERSGLAERTLVAVVSDHGETLGELLDRFGYAFDHSEFAYLHQLHVPLILALPGADSSRDHWEPVSLVDLMPTLLELLGIPKPAGSYGQSLAPRLRGETVQASPCFSQRQGFQKAGRPFFAGEGLSLVHDRWHLLSFDAMPPELYDLTSDPLEQTNLLERSISSSPGSAAVRDPEISDSADRVAVQRVAEDLEYRLESLHQMVSQPVARGGVVVDPEVIRKLQALGYVN